MNYLTILLDWLPLVGMIFLWWVGVSLALMYLTFVHFGAVMRARELRDARTMTWQKDKMLWLWCMAVLVIGLVLDLLTNIIVATVVMLEPPKELLTTYRLIRWNHTTSTSWWTRNMRKPFVDLGKSLLDKMDTDGQHIK
jgi:uncharacterized membrane protein